jgi:predicted house-cleaning noncanonical NTP pyrophosphatase (MazG superfamily)
MLKDGKIFSKHEFDEAQNEEYLRQLLEKLLEKCPEIIVPATREGEPAKNINITREFGVSSGSIDLLGARRAQSTRVPILDIRLIAIGLR